MPDPVYVPLVLTLVLGSACFACFTWGTLRHFRWEAKGSPGAWGISLLSWAGYFTFLWMMLARGVAQIWPLACLLFAASIALWAWTIETTRRTPPTLAFTGDEPQFLLDRGPYRLVRHPFYGSYMLFWIGAGLAGRGIESWVAALIIGAVYWVATRHEEAKFSRSPLAGRYAAYAARTGRFVPRLPIFSGDAVR